MNNHFKILVVGAIVAGITAALPVFAEEGDGLVTTTAKTTVGVPIKASKVGIGDHTTAD